MCPQGVEVRILSTALGDWIWNRICTMICWSKPRKQSVDRMLQWFLDKGSEKWEAKWRCQISCNHEHLSKKDARKKITEVREAVRKRFPKLLRRLEAVWRESKEREHPVNLSFYIDKEKLWWKGWYRQDSGKIHQDQTHLMDLLDENRGKTRDRLFPKRESQMGTISEDILMA